MAGYGTGCIWEAGEINKHLLTHNCINLLYQQSKCSIMQNIITNKRLWYSYVELSGEGIYAAIRV